MLRVATTHALHKESTRNLAPHELRYLCRQLHETGRKTNGRERVKSKTNNPKFYCVAYPIDLVGYVPDSHYDSFVGKL